MLVIWKWAAGADLAWAGSGLMGTKEFDGTLSPSLALCACLLPGSKLWLVIGVEQGWAEGELSSGVAHLGGPRFRDRQRERVEQQGCLFRSSRVQGQAEGEFTGGRPELRMVRVLLFLPAQQHALAVICHEQSQGKYGRMVGQ